jgi:UDP-glucose 4-epimerase
MPKKKILITGVAGFIGSNLADRLIKEGYTGIIGIDNLSQGVLEQVPKEVEFHKLDIRSKEIISLFKDVDVVFHLAAKTCVPECQLDPYETADINVMGTLNVFDACRAAGVRKVIYVESSAVYEGSTKLPTPETEFAPQTIYAVSKATDHLFGKAYQEFYGMKMVGLRYFNVYGPRQDYRRATAPLMSMFIIRLLMGKKLQVYGDGTDRRDYVHVDDVNDLHLRLVENETAFGNQLTVLNVGSETNNNILEIMALIEEVMGVKAEWEFAPNTPGAAKATLADISTPKRLLGWEPKQSLKEGIQGMVDYIKAEIAKGNINKI